MNARLGHVRLDRRCTLPWEVIGTCVHKMGSKTSIPGGCHKTHEEAVRHMQALYANEPKAKSEMTFPPMIAPGLHMPKILGDN